MSQHPNSLQLTEDEIMRLSILRKRIDEPWDEGFRLSGLIDGKHASCKFGKATTQALRKVLSEILPAGCGPTEA